MVTKREKILKFAEKHGVFRAADCGVREPRAALSRMVARNELVRVGRGLYALQDHEISEYHSFVEASKCYPGGVICLISALYFHGIGTQMPYATWMMRKDRKSTPADTVPVHFVYSKGPPFLFGIEKHVIEGIKVMIYNPAKTIADCFKYRNKIGLDIAIEALQDGWEKKMFTMDELWNAVTVCRVQNIIQPYIEMLVK